MVNVDSIVHNTIDLDRSTRKEIENIATFIVTSLASARFPAEGKNCALDLKSSLMNVFVKGENNNLDHKLLNKATSLIQHAIAYYNATSNTDLELTYDINNPTLFQTNKRIPLDDVEKLVRSIAYKGEIQHSKKQLAFNQIESIKL